MPVVFLSLSLFGLLFIQSLNSAHGDGQDHIHKEYGERQINRNNELQQSLLASALAEQCNSSGRLSQSNNTHINIVTNPNMIMF